MNSWRRLTLLFAATFAGMAGAAMLTFWLRPFESVVFLRKNALKLHGVARVRAATLEAYESESCERGRPCSCVGFVHGLGDSALTWDKVFLGKKGAPPPPSGTRLLAVELPGSEGSEAPASEDGFAVPAMARAVGDALASRCPRWTLVGNSLGGWVAAWTALERPELIDRLVLVNAAGLSDASGTLVETAKTLRDPTVENMKAFVARAYHRHDPIPARAWPSIVASIRSRPTARIVGAFKEADLLDARASGIRARTTVLWGEADGVVPMELGRRFAKLIPGAELVTVKDCGHLPQQECPAAVSKAVFEPSSGR